MLGKLLKGQAARSADLAARELALLAQVERGDREAFAQLYRAYFPRLARFLDRMTRNPATIEEIINDTMMVVWQRPEGFDHSCRLSTWIFGIAYRKALKALSRADDPVESEPDDQPADAALQPEAVFSLHQLQDRVARALDLLPDAQRTVVNLACYHEMGYEEIASIMGCPVNTVKTRMFNARARLRTLLGGELEIRA